MGNRLGVGVPNAKRLLGLASAPTIVPIAPLPLCKKDRYRIQLASVSAINKVT